MKQNNEVKKLLEFAPTYPKHAVIFIVEYNQAGEPVGRVITQEGRILNANATLTCAKVIADYQKAKLVIKR